MSRPPGGRRRAGRGISVIGAGAGVLGAAALIAALQTGLPAAAGATALSATSRSVGSGDGSPTAGPLEIPTIGVVAPGFDDPYLTIAVTRSPTSTIPSALRPAATPVDIPTLVDPGPAPSQVLADPPVQDPIAPPADPGTSPARIPDDGTTTPTEPATETPTPTENPPVAETPPPTAVPPPIETPAEPTCPAEPTDGTTDPTADPTTACPPDPCTPPDADPATEPTDPTTEPAVTDPAGADPAAPTPAAPTCEPVAEPVTPTPTP
jgi:hypothetical protein